MRTAPVAPAYLGQPEALAEAARAVIRTPAVAARYTTLTTGIPARTALAELRGLLDTHG